MLRIGFFSELLKDCMAREDVSAKALSRRVECSYEHVRRMLRGETLPSPKLLLKLCEHGFVPKSRAERFVEIDRARKKFGSTFWTCLGMNPKLEEFYVLWQFLTREQQNMAHDFLKFCAARRQTETHGLSADARGHA